MRTIGVVLAVALIAALAVGKAWTRPAAGALQCQPAQPFRAAFPSWSPAGDSVAFSVANAESAAVVRATPGTVRYTGLATSFDSAPTRIVWAPVGEMIAWQKRTGAISIAPQGRNTFERELVHAQFGTVTELGDWSPDARHLVFMRDGRITRSTPPQKKFATSPTVFGPLGRLTGRRSRSSRAATSESARTGRLTWT